MKRKALIITKNRKYIKSTSKNDENEYYARHSFLFTYINNERKGRRGEKVFEV